MRWADIPFDASSRTLRQFAGIWIVFFGLLACYYGFWRATPVPWAAYLLGGLALVVGPLGLIKPEAIRPIFVGWLIVAFPIGWLVSKVLLGVLYYGMFTPLAVVFRLIGRDALVRRHRPETDTYWVPKPAIADVGRYYRQF